MTRIEATCPTCGPVERSPQEFELAVCDEPSASWYAFDCPECDQRIQKHAEARVVQLLIAEGVRPSRWSLPDEVREVHEGPPISLDDVLDFHLLLERHDWMDELLQHQA